MPDEQILREKAREAIRVGNLPITKPVRTFGGPIVGGAVCPVCDGLVGRDDIGLEIEFHASPREKSLADTLDRLRAVPEVRRYHLHLRCFAAWEFERTKVSGESV
jgi:hypothetical protein